MGIGCLSKRKLQNQLLYNMPMKKETFSRNVKYINRPDIVVIPDIEESKNTTLRKVLATSVLLAFVIALVVALILLLRSDETSDDLNMYSTTEIHTTPISYSGENVTKETTTDFTKSTTEIQTTPFRFPGSTVTTETTTNSTKTTTEIQTTPFLIHGPNVTVGSRGKGFIVLFTKNIVNSTKNVYVTSENSVQMNITTSPYLNASYKDQIDRTEIIPSSQHILLPNELELKSFRKEIKSVLIETSNDVFLISHDDGYGTVGSTTHIPLHKLSTKYVVISTEPEATRTSQVAMSAIEDNSTISITFKMKRNVPLIIEGKTFYSGDVFNLFLDRFETYQIEHSTDLTGTFIESSVPIAVFSGNDCNQLENTGACDHLIEQLPPITSVDKTYIVPPNSDDRDTLIRITAIENSIISYKIGSSSQPITLTKLDSFDTRISSSQTCFIESDVPLLVTAFGLNSRSSTLGDPSMTIIPGLDQYLDYYKIVVPSGYDHNYVSIMMKHFSKDSLRINSTVINAGDVVFEENVSYGNVTYNVRSIRVVEGELTASTVNGERFGLVFAGVTYYEAYGFSGNSMLLD